MSRRTFGKNRPSRKVQIPKEDGPMVVALKGRGADVLEIRHYEAGDHPASPIRDDWRAAEFWTLSGSRWTGVHTDGSFYADPRATFPTDPSPREDYLP